MCDSVVLLDNCLLADLHTLGLYLKMQQNCDVVIICTSESNPDSISYPPNEIHLYEMLTPVHSFACFQNLVESMLVMDCGLAAV